MALFDFRIVRPESLELKYFRDGGSYTGLIRKVLSAYLTLGGCTSKDWSIDCASYTKDGGIDGLINCGANFDPIGLLAPKSVLQFKSGDTTAAEAVSEVLKAPKDGRTRVADYVRDGYQLVWFVAKRLSDRDRVDFEDELAKAVSSVKSGSPRPSVIDSNRLSEYVARVPAVGLEIQSSVAVNTITQVLTNRPHSDIPFEPPDQFDGFVDDLHAFIGDPKRTFLRYQGEPGIGKSRRVLEALNRDETLRACTLYFRDQSQIGDCMTLAIQEQLRAVIVVDDYIDFDTPQPRVKPEEIPEGCKVIVIRHSFKSERRPENNEPFLDLPPLSNDELERVLSYYTRTRGVTEAMISQAIALTKRNVRLAKWICERVGPGAELTENAFDNMIQPELDNTDKGINAIQLLALVRILPLDRLEDFGNLIQREPGQFREECRHVSQRSGFIQFNDTLMYVSIPLIAQLAVTRFWNSNQSECKRIFANPGTFSDDLLWRANDMPEGPTKENLRSFFELPPGAPTLERLQRADYGRRLLNLTTANPERYLPLLHGLFKRDRASLHEFKYEGGGGIGRREVIWTLRQLAQFEEFFLSCEEVVYWMARDEVPSPYSNVASTYWVDWFHPYFDYTNYPYDARLDLLESRIGRGDQRDKELAVMALSSPFPHVGSDVPRDRVGGRLVPPETRLILGKNLVTAVQRIPQILRHLISVGDEAIRQQVAKAWVGSIYDWLGRTHDPALVASVINTPGFPDTERRAVIVKLHHMTHARESLGKTDPETLASEKLNASLINLISRDDDDLADAAIVLKEGWRSDRKRSLEDRESKLIKRVANEPGFIDKIRSIIMERSSHGAAPFGKRLAAEVDDQFFWRELELSRRDLAATPFVLGLIDGFVIAHPEIRARLLPILDETEARDPFWSQAIRYLLGPEEWAVAGARLVRQGMVSPKAFSNAWVPLDFGKSKVAKDLLRAIHERASTGDVDAASTLVELAYGCTDREIQDEEVLQIFLDAYLGLGTTKRWLDDSTWVSVGEWLMKFKPDMVIEGAVASAFAGGFGVEGLLSAAAPNYSRQVLESIDHHLSVSDTPWIASGSFNAVFGMIEPELFEEWIRDARPEVAEFVAGQLPPPFIGPNGTAIVPAQTRAFWRIHPPSSPGFERLMATFRSNTFNTGVYWGHGIDLFSARVRLAEQLRLDDDPAIALWADMFHAESKAMLERGRRDEAFDQARAQTEDR
ncbi:MAG TPA: hypothetical protein VHE55_09965 [Fimbriimonadaceae bacterium]|nr:hypothetical protein [Fimbriimonadaceae bacterium]